MVLGSVAGCVTSPEVSRWSQSDFLVYFIASHPYPAPLWGSGLAGVQMNLKDLPMCPCPAASLWGGEAARLGWAWPRAQSCPSTSCTTSPERIPQGTSRSSLRVYLLRILKYLQPQEKRTPQKHSNSAIPRASAHNVFPKIDSFSLSYCRSTRGPNRASSAWRQWKPCWFMRTKNRKFKTISAFTSQMDFLFALWLFTR